MSKTFWHNEIPIKFSVDPKREGQTDKLNTKRPADGQGLRAYSCHGIHPGKVSMRDALAEAKGCARTLRQGVFMKMFACACT